MSLPKILEEKALAERKTTDLSEDDLKKVQEYADAGMPGLAALNEGDLYKIMDLYLGGSTYWQISSALNIKRITIMYLSHTYKWYLAKQEYLTELQEKMKARVIDAKLVSQDFLLLLTQAWQKRISGKLQRYLSSDDQAPLNEINLKEVSQLLKTIEMVNSLNSEGKDSKGRSPAVGLNLGDGVTIERSGDNKVTITPKEKTIGDMLKHFADHRRQEEEKAKEAKKSDIKQESTNQE